ncbi:MAG: caspase family protein [Rhizobiaceae bacterium]
MIDAVLRRIGTIAFSLLTVLFVDGHKFGVANAQKPICENANVHNHDVQFKFTNVDSARWHAGKSLKFSWSHLLRQKNSCVLPAYLVVSAPARSRFAGHGFIALPSGAPTPFGIRVSAKRTNAFIPLHVVGNAKGSAALRLFVIGSATVNVDLVLLPKRSASNAVRENSMHRRAVIKRQFNIVPGSIRPVARDVYDVRKPLMITHAPDRSSRIIQFKSFYQVVSSATGGLIAEKPGVNANYSPTGRFVAAFVSNGAALEVIDVVAGEAIYRTNLTRVQVSEPMIHEVAWSKGDAFLVLSKNIHDLEVVATHTDRQAHATLLLGCQVCYAWASSAVHIDLERSLLFLGSTITSFTPRSLLFDDDLARGGRGVIDYPYEREKAIVQTLFATHARAKPESYSRKVADDSSVERRWLLPGGLKLSHPHDDDEYVKYVAPRQTQAPRAVEITSHAAAKRSSEITAAAAINRLVRRGTATTSASAPTFLSRVERRLSEVVGLKFDNVISPVNHPKRTVQDWLAELSTLSPAIRKRLALYFPLHSPTIPIKDCGLPPNEEPAETSKDSIVLDSVETLWDWRIGSSRLLLLQMHCFSIGATGKSYPFGDVYLFRQATKDQEATIKKLDALFDPQIHLSSNDEIVERTIDGIRNQTSSWDAKLYGDATLLVTSVTRGAAGLIDTRSGKLKLKIALVNSDDLISVRMAANGRLVVQINSTGEIHFYASKSGARVARGTFVDDELVVFDTNGYFAATPEGAAFVSVRFPGVPGFFGFEQFSAKLHRPDILRKLLKDPAIVSRAPVLHLPPRAKLSVSTEGLAARKLSIMLSASASPGLQLREALFYADGRRVRRIALSGEHKKLSLRLSVPAETRWITASVVDVGGLESVPQTVSLPKQEVASKPVGRLLAVSVGTDRYMHPDIPDLKYAVADAQQFARGLVQGQNAYYRNVVVMPPLVDVAQLGPAIAQTLSLAAGRATAQDTLMLLIAGHGMRGPGGRLYLAGGSTNPDDIASTGVPWSAIGKHLADFPGRVVVFLDACHSGAAGQTVTNDDIVFGLMRRRSGKSITVVSASKGRQFSIESSRLQAGVFTAFLMDSLTNAGRRRKYDTNGNSVLELSELYRALKRRVTTFTKGQQTPWIARNWTQGEVPLF